MTPVAPMTPVALMAPVAPMKAAVRWRLSTGPKTFSTLCQVECPSPSLRSHPDTTSVVDYYAFKIEPHIFITKDGTTMYNRLCCHPDLTSLVLGGEEGGGGGRRPAGPAWTPPHVARGRAGTRSVRPDGDLVSPGGQTNILPEKFATVRLYIFSHL